MVGGFQVGAQWWEGSKGANVRGNEGEQRGKRWGEGGELNGIFLQVGFRRGMWVQMGVFRWGCSSWGSVVGGEQRGKR